MDAIRIYRRGIEAFVEAIQDQTTGRESAFEISRAQSQSNRVGHGSNETVAARMK